MRKKTILTTIGFIGLLFSVGMASAQGDSTQVTNDKKLTKLISNVNTDSGKLVIYQGQVSQFRKDKEDAASKAQESADDNKKAADRLADNAQDKKLARKAHDAAKTAASDSRKAREASSKLDRLENDIAKTTKKLEKDRTKLREYRAAQAPAVTQH